MSMSDFNQSIIDEFRANEGRVGGPFAGATVLLLHTVGARSNKPRVNPLVCLELEGRTFIFASKAGAPSHPHWYHNLLAHPDTEVEIGTETRAVTARVLEEPERTRIYEVMAARSTAFAEYQAKTTRRIPVIELVARG